MVKMYIVLYNHYILIKLLLLVTIFLEIKSHKLKCSRINDLKIDPLALSKIVIPELEGKKKGENGKIAVIGGSVEYTGAPFFAAITALKVGADLVYVISTENAAPIIKTYSPELIVYPYLNTKSLSKVKSLLPKMDVIIIGPGLGREDHTLSLIYDIIQACRDLKKPLVIDADGLYAVSKNLTVLWYYPSPGVILTPNHHEIQHLKDVYNVTYYGDWGTFAPVLIKGKEDTFYSSDSASYGWSLSAGGSGRRAGGQGDILAGALGTFYNWALKANLCENNTSVQLAQSIASYAAAKFTRMCNSKAFELHGRSMTASDMLNKIHEAFEDLFGK